MLINSSIRQMKIQVYNFHLFRLILQPTISKCKLVAFIVLFILTQIILNLFLLQYALYDLCLATIKLSRNLQPLSKITKANNFICKYISVKYWKALSMKKPLQSTLVFSCDSLNTLSSYKLYDRRFILCHTVITNLCGKH